MWQGKANRLSLPSNINLMKKSIIISFFSLLVLSLFSVNELSAQHGIPQMSPLSRNVKSNFLLHFKSLKEKDRAGFNKTISSLFPSRNLLPEVYQLSVMHYPQCNGTQVISEARQIPLKYLKKKFNIVLKGDRDKVVIEEGFLVLFPMKEKLSSSQRLPFDVTDVFEQFTEDWGFTPSYSMAFIVDGKGLIWKGENK